jgi:hypothetical protein
MYHNRTTPQSQADVQVLDQIDVFFDKFRIGTLLDRCGIRKPNKVTRRTLKRFKKAWIVSKPGGNLFAGHKKVP